jgi:hypothetical protein
MKVSSKRTYYSGLLKNRYPIITHDSTDYLYLDTSITDPCSCIFTLWYRQNLLHFIVGDSRFRPLSITETLLATYYVIRFCDVRNCSKNNRVRIGYPFTEELAIPNLFL